MRQIPETDWKKLRSLKDQLLQQACENILSRIKLIIDNQEKDSHKAYLNLWKALKQEDKELGLLFDDLRRTTALFKLAAWKNHGLLSGKDFDLFSEETRKAVNSINSL